MMNSTAMGPLTGDMLYSIAAEKMGAGGNVRKLRLYAKGGMVEAAEEVREAGRDEDEVLLHLTPDEFEVIKATWGEPEINPVTGLPEYGFLKKLFKGAKKIVKGIAKSPIFKAVAPIALSVFAPGIGTALGGALGASGAAAPILGNALVHGGLSALGGDNFVQGALSGAVRGGLGRVVGQGLGFKPGAGADVIGSALVGGGGSALAGKGLMPGLVSGGLNAALVRPMQEKIAGGIRTRLGYDQPSLQMGANTAINPITGEPVAAEELLPGTPGEMYMHSPITGERVAPEFMASGASAVEGPGNKKFMDMAIKYGLPAVGILGMMGAGGGGGGKSGKAPNVPVPEGFNEPLPQYSLNRGTPRTMKESDYYTYGQVGAPQSGEFMFMGPSTVGPASGAPPAMGGAGEDPNAAIARALAAIKGGFAMGGGVDRPGMPMGMAHRAEGHYYRGGGSGRDDLIDAKLSDGEYVMDAETVALLGDGSVDEGARRLDEMRQSLRRHKGQNLAKGKISADAKPPMAYMKTGGAVRKKVGGRARLRKPKDDTFEIVDLMSAEIGAQ